ncbi:MAG: hypothetical protein AAF580_03225 [Pseudomonadota bacterium]
MWLGTIGRLAQVRVFCATIVLFSIAVATADATPVPKPNPIREALAARSAESAFASLLPSETGTQPTTAAGYAPSGTVTTSPPRQVSEGVLYVVGKLLEGGTPINDGLAWRVFREKAGEELELVHKASNGDLEVRLPAGRYIVHAAYGRATLARHYTISRGVVSDTMILNAGGLQLMATLDDNPVPVPEALSMEVFLIEDAGRRSLGEIAPGSIARLPAGAYHVQSRYGELNAVRGADVTVKAGKLTRVTLRHQAGLVHFKLVRQEGGKPIADTEWAIYNGEGERVFQRIGAVTSLTLAAGEYQVVARHRSAEFHQTFTVQSGMDADVTVLAQRL